MSKRNLLTDLESLSDDEMDAVSRLISKFAKRHEGGDEEQAPVPKKRDRKRKSKPKRPVDEQEQEVIIEQQVGRKKPRNAIQTPDQAQRPTTRSGRGRTQPRSEANQQRVAGRGRGRRGQGGPKRGRGRQLARTETVALSSENRFEKMRERNKFKQDAEIDRKLWGNNEVSERPDEYQPVEVMCQGCNLWFDINPGLVYLDEDTGEPVFTCDNCARRER